MRWTRENIEKTLEQCDDKATGKRLIRKLGAKVIEQLNEETGKMVVTKVPPPSKYKVGSLIYDECLEITEGKAWINGNEARKADKVEALVELAVDLGLISTPALPTLRNFMCGEAA